MPRDIARCDTLFLPRSPHDGSVRLDPPLQPLDARVPRRLVRARAPRYLRGLRDVPAGAGRGRGPDLRSGPEVLHVLPEPAELPRRPWATRGVAEAAGADRGASRADAAGARRVAFVRPAVRRDRAALRGGPGAALPVPGRG